MKRIYNKNNLENARNLRKNQTETEQILWSRLRNRQFFNLKFLRQVPVGNYIADFLCQSEKLIIEIDVSQHIENENYDENRTKELTKIGYKVIRVYNNDIFNNLDNVLEYIYNEIDKI